MKNDAVIKHLRKDMPHGHRGFIPMLLEQMELHSTKNFKYAYGGDPMGNFNRVAAIMRLYPDINWAQPECVALIWSFKQLDAALWMLNSGHDAKSLEGIDACLNDVGVYAALTRLIRRTRKDAE